MNKLATSYISVKVSWY